MKDSSVRDLMKIVSVGGLLGCFALAVWGWNTGILTSQQAMQGFVSRAGTAGILLFVAFQMVQVVIPILPGGLSCLAGVLLFGPVMGFLTNYVGICIGSMLAFAAARMFGRPLILKLFSQSTVRKYEHWTDRGSPFGKLFAIAIFLPVAPDDFLCYLAGTTAMKWSQFNLTIWLCKPFAIAMYSLGLSAIWKSLATTLA